MLRALGIGFLQVLLALEGRYKAVLYLRNYMLCSRTIVRLLICPEYIPVNVLYLQVNLREATFHATGSTSSDARAICASSSRFFCWQYNVAIGSVCFAPLLDCQ